MKSKFKDLSNLLLSEMSLPEGFTYFDVMSLDQFIDEEEKQGNLVDIDINEATETAVEMVINTYIEEEIDDAEIQDVDIKALMKQRMGEPSRDIDIAERPEKMLHRSNIVDENGNVININKLKKKIMTRPSSLITQNAKMKVSGNKSGQRFYDSSLPSYMGLFVDEDTGEFKVVKTCPSAGECTKFCYASKGNYVIHSPSSLKFARIVNFLMNDPEGFKEQMVAELEKAEKTAAKKNKTLVLRWHDSGDFISEKYLQLAFDVARRTPNVLHYAYTKQIPLIRKLESEKPDNFVFNFSFGGEHDEGIDPLVDKHAQVVPKDLFKDLPKNKREDGSIEFPPLSLKTLKRKVAKAFKIRPTSILSYDELINTPLKKGKRWNVLVWKGHGDDSATRKDVLGTYLLFH